MTITFDSQDRDRLDMLLMCPPDYFAIHKADPKNGHANDFSKKGCQEYSKDPAAFVAKARSQWNNLKNAFISAGASVKTLRPNPDMPDQVFTADPTLSLVSVNPKKPFSPLGVSLVTHFANVERAVEVNISKNYIKTFIKNRFIYDHNYLCEGTGDNVYDPFRDVFWSGFVENAGRENAATGRSDLRSHQFLASATGVDVVSLAVKRPFFHIDTAMAPLPNGHIIAFKDGMQPEAFDKLITEGFERYGMDVDEYLILVDEDDANKYACNVRAIGNTIVMPECSEKLKETIRSKGYEVTTCDVSQFLYAGGGVHCLSNNLMETRIKGGLYEKADFAKKPLPSLNM